ncbi:uncharacterized protein LOC121837284 [Ixodes scapularis]|uniref:uncharacterized protein LOC121837284 n=1 Tax=Ixodes scapularis TaxID=6945 RepID=UPI001C38086F|nr:uncharacterized protein LOC121837284 [Ixodes scapularis]
MGGEDESSATQQPVSGSAGVPLSLARPSTPVPTSTTKPPPAWPSDKTPIVCTIGNLMKPTTVGPKDGICDYVFYDFLYSRGSGTFVDADTRSLRVFLKFMETMTQNKTAVTKFGMGISFL